jgi:hypothetical protein
MLTYLEKGVCLYLLSVETVVFGTKIRKEERKVILELFLDRLLLLSIVSRSGRLFLCCLFFALLCLLRLFSLNRRISFISKVLLVLHCLL